MKHRKMSSKYETSIMELAYSIPVAICHTTAFCLKSGFSTLQMKTILE